MRPIPPTGYVRFEFKHVPGPKGSGMRIVLCPNCGKDFYGVWHPSLWQDQDYQALVDQSPKAGPGCYWVGGEDCRSQWSRYNTGECYRCHCKFWHDFGGDDPRRDHNDNPIWHFYYLPSIGQLTLF